MDRVEQIVNEISKLMPKMARRMHRGSMAHSKLSISQLSVLLAVHEEGISQTGKLSKAMGVSAPTITGIVDRLVRARYLKRIRDQKDRRAINIVLTDKGKTEVQNLSARMKDKWRSILSRLEAKDREAYLDILKKIFQVIEGSNEEPD